MARRRRGETSGAKQRSSGGKTRVARLGDLERSEKGGKRGSYPILEKALATSSAYIESTVGLTQTTINKGGSSSCTVKLPLNNGRKRIGRKAWNQLGRGFHRGGMQPMILDASLRSS